MSNFTSCFLNKATFLIVISLAFFCDLWAQPLNDDCSNATDIPGVISDGEFVCLDGSNLNALPEVFNNDCYIGEFPAVWFRIMTDGNATLMNLQVTSSQINSPTLTLFHLIDSCTNLEHKSLTQSNYPCIIGTNGKAEAIGTNVGASEVYYLVVGSRNSNGGDFELCVNTISVASTCVTSREIEITARSSGGPLDGPFLPGETVSICMNVNEFSAANNGCQWFQGLVPVFGNGWDPSSFDINGQPINATLNGNPIGVAGNGLYGPSTWDWFSDVGYHHPNIFFQVYDIDGNGTIDMCNTAYDPDCVDQGGIMGGCCGPCWNDAGDILPPGWFAYGINGTCPTPGPPITVDWGDGNSCSSGMGPWSFCFDLVVRNYPDCAEQSNTADLALSFFTFSDGEVGSWTGGPSICAMDQLTKLTLPFSCCMDSVSYITDTLDAICSGGIIEYFLDDPDIEYWDWEVDVDSVIGLTAGNGLPGIFIHDTAHNPSAVKEYVIYTIQGFANGFCPVLQIELGIDVLPAIDIEFNVTGPCDPPGQITITPSVTGGLGDFTYLWLETGDTTPFLIIPDPVIGSTYHLMVSDSNCSVASSVTIGELEVAVIASDNEVCLDDCPVLLSGSASGGMGSYSYQWLLPDGSIHMGDTLLSCMTGEHMLLAVDSNGCTGVDSLILNILENPEIGINFSSDTNVICAGDTIRLDALIFAGSPPFNINWMTPAGLISEISVDAYLEGSYSLTVIDDSGCESVQDTFIYLSEAVFDFGFDTIYAEGNVTLDAGTGWDQYFWSTGENTPSISVDLPGWYIVSVTDEFGCSTFDSVYVDIQTNIENLGFPGFIKIFPNPTNGSFTVSGDLLNCSRLSIGIWNMFGEILYKHELEKAASGFSHDINLEKVPGVIFLRIGTEKGDSVQKIILQ